MPRRYDYVIVGAGSAGCVLAARLSEEPTTNVLLLEDGPDSDPSLESASFFDVAAASGRVHPNVMVERAEGLPPTPYQLGRGVGGSSAVNGMIGMWGMPDDYDRWERDLGCVGWSWSSVAPMFAKLLVPLEPSQPAEWGSVDQALVDAAQALGHPYCPGSVDPACIGVGPASLTRRNGQRVSAGNAYLDSARSRRNLVVRTDSSVDRVLVEDRTAVGVQTARGEVIEAVEVIVSAGAVHSPLILLRSGIDRPAIGRGVKDHPSCRIDLELHEANDPRALAAATLLRWSSSSGEADLQLVPLNHLGEGTRGARGALMAAVMSVHSSGSVELVDGAPMIRFNMLDDDRDRIRLREAARHMVALAASEPFRAIGAPAAELPDDDAAFNRWLFANLGDYMHASCSCRMGRASDLASVVDVRGRVHGYSALRVCDASIFPDMPRANTHLPVVMVAERIAALIKAS